MLNEIERFPTVDPNPELTLIVQACSRVLLGATLSLLQNDPHQWSERPCGTCHSITLIVGKRFGCDLFRYERAVQRRAKEQQAAQEEMQRLADSEPHGDQA